MRKASLNIRLLKGVLISIFLSGCSSVEDTASGNSCMRDLSLIGYEDFIPEVNAEDIDIHAEKVIATTDSVIELVIKRGGDNLRYSPIPIRAKQKIVADEEQALVVDDNQVLVVDEEQALVVDDNQVLVVDEEQALVADDNQVLVADEEQALVADEENNIANINSDLLIVDGDTVPAVLPETLWGRYDRGMKNYLFIPKGEWMFGMTASYGSIDIEDIELLSLLSGLEMSASIFSIHPEVAYVIGSNRMVGMRIAYSETDFDLSGLDLNFMDDLSFSLSDVIYNQKDYSASVFYRYYIGLDNAHRFALFNEADITFLSGTGVFSRMYDGVRTVTNSSLAKASLNYSPGLSVFIQEYVSFNISFGIFGLYYLKEKQVIDDLEIGSRTANGASFQFNLFNIKFGVAVHI